MGAAIRRLRRAMPPYVMLACALCCAIILTALLAPLIAPSDPTSTSSFNLLDSELPPAFLEGGDPRYVLGTDNQGRDLLSAILYGTRISVMIGLGAVAFAATIGISLGLLSGYLGGWADVLVMRIADVFLSLPTILLALLVAGIARAVIPGANTVFWAPIILIGAIGINEWVQYARTVRAATMVEASRDYVRAVRIMGLPVRRILFRHILPNAMGPILVISTINLAAAVLTEATLSFLGVGMPPDYPSLGTLIRIGNEYAFSGIWWISTFPALTLVVLVLSVNIVGDWLRDRFNPKLEERS
ncbi:ABC transporter permease [Aureimonas populi]|uniref:ABC transporter permease n=1 Tax=Aureimonas populi TaxID=1701758 RepID=A0ABW5CQU5_9HYPH|nr:ABC transporter permease [Aureimonas populi]